MPSKIHPSKNEIPTPEPKTPAQKTQINGGYFAHGPGPVTVGAFISSLLSTLKCSFTPTSNPSTKQFLAHRNNSSSLSLSNLLTTFALISFLCATGFAIHATDVSAMRAQLRFAIGCAVLHSQILSVLPRQTGRSRGRYGGLRRFSVLSRISAYSA